MLIDSCGCGAITSEAMVTTGSHTSGRVLQDLRSKEAPPKRKKLSKNKNSQFMSLKTQNI